MKRIRVGAACFLVAGLATTALSENVAVNNDRPRYEVVQCLANPQPILGTAAVYRLLVANHSGGELFVSIPVIHDGISLVTYPGYGRLCSAREKGAAQWANRIPPGEIRVFNYVIPLSYTSRAVHLGKQRVTVEVRVASGLVIVGDDRRAVGSATADSVPSEDVMVWRVARTDFEINPGVVEGGRVYTFEGEYEIVEPAERDRAFYEAYVAPSLALGDCWWSGEAKWKQDTDRRAMATSQEKVEAAQTSFESFRTLPRFQRFEDNGYYAFRHSLERLAGTRSNIIDTKSGRLRDPIGETSDNNNRRGFLQQRAEGQRADYYLGITPLAWDWYLDAASAAYLGSSWHAQGIDVIRRAATESPDCVTKYLANELLLRYEEQQAAHETDGGDSK